MQLLAERYTHTVWNYKDLNAIEEAFDPNVIIHSSSGETRGHAEMTRIVKIWLTAFPNLQIVNTNSQIDNDRVTLKWKASVTHLGVFKGIKPTGNAVCYNGSTPYRFEGEKIVEYWAEVDMDTLLNQLDVKSP